MRILYADDEDIIRRGMKEILEGYGHRVTLAEDGEDAIALMKLACYDLIITDYRMPFKNGLDVIEAAQKLMPKPEIWFASGELSPELENRARDAGAKRAFFKPKLAAELPQRLGELALK